MAKDGKKAGKNGGYTGLRQKFFQAEHALYTLGLDENRGSSDFVHDIWICYKLQCTKFFARQYLKIKGIKANQK